MTTKIANCGGLILDGETLTDVGQVVTTVGSTPSGSFQANCGKLFDSAIFKMVDGVVTDIDNMGTVTPLKVFCGGLIVDSGCFSATGGKLAFDNISGECDITSFKIGEVDGTITGTDIAVTVAHGTDVTSLTPTIVVSSGATVSPTSGTAKDFTNPVNYVVTAEGGATKTYKVTVTVAEE